MLNSKVKTKYNLRKKKDARGNIIIPIFFFLYLILPEYFALEISENLPLLTASRALILFLLFYCLYISDFKFKFFNLGGIGICFLLVILLDVVHLYDSFSSSIKDILSLCFDCLFVIWLSIILLDTNTKVVKAVQWIVYGSVIIGIFAIIETFSGVNIFYYLATTSRESMQSQYSRLGLIRASGPFSHAVKLANYCVVVLPFSLYMFESKKKNRYLFIAILNILTCLLTESRGQILLMAIFIILMFVFKSKKLRHKYLKYLLLLIPIIVVIFIIFPDIYETFLNLIKSALRTLGFDVDLSADFGNNESGMDSRLLQLSGFVYIFRENVFLFGFGADAHTRGLVKYYFPQFSAWSTSTTFDVGYVAYAMQYGLVGLIVYMYLFVSCLIKAKRLSNKNDPKNMNNAFFWIWVGILLCLTTATFSLDMISVFIGLMLAYNHQNEGKVKIKI